MNNNQKWAKIVDNIRPIISENAAIQLLACELSEENGVWYLNAPNQFALKPLEKLKQTIDLALEKEGYPAPKLRVVEPGLFDKKNEKKPKNSLFSSELNSDYRFDNFVVGQSNNEAFAAAKGISEGKFSSDFNPLLIYGGTGLGKSHLMHAVGNTLKAKGLNNIVYRTAEDFTNDYIRAISNANMEEFNEFYRGADALLIDDVQFFGGREKSQSEFFHTFNTLFNRKRPIILTCDRYPKEIENLESRLKSRFGSGLTVSVVPPEFETRVAILQNKIPYLENFHPSTEVIHYIAHQIASNVRDLEGALRKYYALSGLRGEDSIRLAQEALTDLINANSKQISMDNIRNVVAKHYQIKVEDLDSKSRKKELVIPRQIAMHLIRHLTQHSTTEIGNRFGGRDHSTVLNAINKINEMLEKNYEFKELYRALEMTITG